MDQQPLAKTQAVRLATFNELRAAKVVNAASSPQSAGPATLFDPRERATGA